VSEETKRAGPRVESLRENLDRVGVLSRLEASVIVLGAIELARDLHRDGRGETALSPTSLQIARTPGKSAGKPGLALGFDDAPVAANEAYLAPEARENDKTIDEVADVWSLALVCFEALAGARPHEPPWAEERARLHQLRPDIGRPLAALLHRCLCADRAQRSPTLEAFGADFLDALAAPIAAAPDPSRVQIAVAVTAAIVALVAACTVGERTPVAEPPKPSANPGRIPLWVEPPVVSSDAAVPREPPSGR
jgi:hypothetical protein